MSAALARLVPATVATWVTPVSHQPTHIHPDEATIVADASIARREEFLAGRACAHRALRSIRCDTAVIPRGVAGQPQWPAGVTGSITHTRHITAAAAARTRNVWALGIDLEPIDPPLDDATARLIRSGDPSVEPPVPPALRPYASKLVFTVKESLYKALFSSTCWRVEFADLAVALDASQGLWRAQLTSQSPLAGQPFGPYEGRLAITAGHVLAVVSLPTPTTPPL